MSAMPDVKRSERTCGDCPITYSSQGTIRCVLRKGAVVLPSQRCLASSAELRVVADQLVRRAG